MSEPVDPIKFDFGFSFQSAASRVKDERVGREKLAERLLKYHVAFLDEILRGILPHDLILLGAESGAGKTDLATNIAKRNAMAGKRVHYFALEAEPLEIERRSKYSMLADAVWKVKAPGCEDLNYADWYLGRCQSIVAPYEAQVEREIGEKLSTLSTYYKGSTFGTDEMRRLLLAIQSETDLIVLDHLHYVDIDDDNENRGFKRTMQMLRDIALAIGRPIILVVHLRKRDGKTRGIVPDMEMVHGSSEIFKICTHAIMLAPARCEPSKNPTIANTFIHVPKDRISGATGLVALCLYDRRVRCYRRGYTLGRPTPAGDGFEPIDIKDRPRWAKNHQAISVLTGNGGDK